MSGILVARCPTVDYVTDHKRERGGESKGFLLSSKNKREKDKKKFPG